MNVDEVGRLLERLEQGVPGVLRDLVRLVEDVDLAAELARRVRRAARAGRGRRRCRGCSAASISTRSSVVPSRMATHEGQASQASPSWRSVQLSALARIRASDVLPVPRGPTKRMACATRPGPDGVAERLDDGLLADDLAERLGAPAAVDGLMRNGRRHQRPRVEASGIEMPCTLRRSDRPRAHHDGRLGPGRSAAPDDDRLVLLPSGPDTVRGSPLRGTRSSTSHRRAAFEDGDLGRGFSPAGADCRYRAPLVPRLARPTQGYPATPPCPLARGVAERAGFEPATGCPEPHFQCGAIVH